MNSPLFFRKVLRTQIEPDFQNLETFQKSQIKNKVIKIINMIPKLNLNMDKNVHLFFNSRLKCAPKDSNLLCKTKHQFGTI